MIAEGTSRSGARALASHLLKTENERVKVLAIRGLFNDTVHTALMEMEEQAILTNCQKPLYHAHLDWKEYERLTDEQQIEAINTLGRQLGLENQPVVIVQHVKNGREHVHAVWSRIDVENERAISDSHNYRNHELAARQIERDYGLERTQGVHVERNGQPRPERGFEKWQFQQAHHSDGPDPRDFRQDVRQAWEQSDNGAAFLHALDDKGYLLANGDKRNSFVVVDRSGDIVALKTTTVGARAADIRAKLSDIDRSTLPGVEQARQQQELRQREQQEASGRGVEAQPIPATIIPAIDTEPGAITMILQQTREPEKARGMMRGALDFLRQLGQAQGDTPARALTPDKENQPVDPEERYHERHIEKSPLEKGFNIFESVSGGIVDMFSGNLNNGQGVEPYRTSSVEQTYEAQQLEAKQRQDAKQAEEKKLSEEKQTAEQKQTEANIAEQRQAPEQQPTQQQGMYAPAMERQEEAFARRAAMMAAIEETACRTDDIRPISQEEYDRRIEEQRLNQDRGIRR